MNENKKIKKLLIKLKKEENYVQELRRSLSAIHNKINDKNDTITIIKNELNKLQDVSNIDVSEHAIIRYLERIKNLNIEEIKREIITSNIKNQYEILGDGIYPNNDFNVVIKNSNVITILVK
jgi:chromosome segregation ATPase